MDEVFVKDRLRLMLDHFSAVGDPREGCKVKYPLPEVLFLVTCASIAGCDDYDEIAAWGEHHRTFLARYAEYFFGTPKEDWLRVVLNRIDPALFEACFMAWAMSLRSDAPDLIALDGKTVRRSGDEAVALRPIHLVSAWASTQRLVLAQEAVDTKERVHGHSDDPRSSGHQRRARHHRRHRHQSHHRQGDHRQGRRLHSRPQAQPANPARRGRSLLFRPRHDRFG